MAIVVLAHGCDGAEKQILFADLERFRMLNIKCLGIGAA
jgi:hypothetical protein